MAFEGDFRDFLAGSTRVTAFVGSSHGARIEPLILPEDTDYPAVVYQRISTVRGHTHDGPDGKPVARFQVDSYAKDVDTAFDLAEGVRKLTDGFKGQMGNTGVDMSFNDDEGALFEEEEAVYRVRQDYMIRYAEATT